MIRRRPRRNEGIRYFLSLSLYDIVFSIHSLLFTNPSICLAVEVAAVRAVARVRQAHRRAQEGGARGDAGGRPEQASSETSVRRYGQGEYAQSTYREEHRLVVASANHFVVVFESLFLFWFCLLVFVCVVVVVLAEGSGLKVWDRAGQSLQSSHRQMTE